FGVSVFFRIYNLSGVLAEPFSDHAEKLFDVADVLNGHTPIFFVRNTGREFFQMYLTAWVAQTFGTGLSFMSLKIGTVLCGIFTLPYIYLIGREYGGHRVALFALLLAGMAYWPNIISRVGLCYPLYPLFAAPALYHLLRGLRASNRNDFILSGLFLGLGLHGYSSFRFVPVVVVIAIGIYILHVHDRTRRLQAVWWLALTAMSALLVFLPLLRYLLDHPADVAYRALTRLSDVETPLPGPAWQIFLQNFWNSLTMFQWSNGEIWVHSIPYRPALDVVSGALLVLGAALVLLRYLRRRDWRDLFLLVAVPLLTMPSTLSLAFPNENPSLNRASGAIIPVFVLAALALDAMTRALASRLAPRRGQVVSWGVALLLLAGAGFQNFDLVFNQFDRQYRQGIWNSSEMAAVVRQFEAETGTVDTAWIVPYPYWVDTRLLSSQSGHFERDFTLWPEDIPATINIPGPKLFLVYPDDAQTINILQLTYPQGTLQVYHASVPGKDFLIFNVPPQ
ncbi:MAG: glycosyltransferase family 39 protein, partial [Anaerolineales bacterium]